MKRIVSLALGAQVIAVWLFIGAAHAQINSPPPPLQGQPSYHLYSVPGVVDLPQLGTFFACTNTTDATIRVGVEIFGAAGGGAGNDPSGSSLDIPAGGMRLFGTDETVWVSIHSDVGGAIGKGSARILATAKSGIICTAFLADPGNDPPTSMADLKVVKKMRQKGD